MSARVRLLRPLPKFGWYNAPVEVDMSREQWLAASSLLGADAVLLDCLNRTVSHQRVNDGLDLGRAAVVEQPAHVKVTRKKK